MVYKTPSEGFIGYGWMGQALCDDGYSYTRMCSLFAAGEQVTEVAVLSMDQMAALNLKHPKLAWVFLSAISNLAYTRLNKVQLIKYYNTI